MPLTTRCRSPRGPSCTALRRLAGGAWRRARRAGRALGYHLEQAALYAQELGQRDEALAERAAERLATAGRRALFESTSARPRAALALARADAALSTRRPARGRPRLGSEGLGESRRAGELAESAADRAHAAADEAGEAARATVCGSLSAYPSTRTEVGELEALGRQSAGLLEPREDHPALVYVWHALAAPAPIGVISKRRQRRRRTRSSTPARPGNRKRAPSVSARRSSRSAAGGRGDRDARGLLPRNHRSRPGMFRALLLAMLRRFDEARQLAED